MVLHPSRALFEEPTSTNNPAKALRNTTPQHPIRINPEGLQGEIGLLVATRLSVRNFILFGTGLPLPLQTMLDEKATGTLDKKFNLGKTTFPLSAFFGGLGLGGRGEYDYRKFLGRV